MLATRSRKHPRPRAHKRPHKRPHERPQKRRQRAPAPVHSGSFTEHQATRLLWRAGFGPGPGQAQQLASIGLSAAVRSLTRPSGPERFIGPRPHNNTNQPLDPINVWGDDHCWWFDRMVRTNQPLMQRMTLIWHSWFATSIDGSTAELMLNQYHMLRSHSLGNFLSLFLDVTKDPAMLQWLAGDTNTLSSPNENYGREMMELFSLGADRGYTQHDVHQQARALTGWTNDWNNRTGQPDNFRFDQTLHDHGVKTIFGKRGHFNWKDSCRLCVEHPLHASYMVTKLWNYFVPVPAPAAEQRALQSMYVNGGYEVRPLVEAILMHPLFYDGPRMVTPPVVYHAGLLRASKRFVDTNDWAWIGSITGQRLFEPPNVSGWDYTRWIDTGTWMARLRGVDTILTGRELNPDDRKLAAGYPAGETAEQALQTALRFFSNPILSAATRQDLISFGRRVERLIKHDWEKVSYRILRQNTLRALIALSPDLQTS